MNRALRALRRDWFAPLVRKAGETLARHSPSFRHKGEMAQIRAASLFDGEYYLHAYPDVARALLDPLEHFVTVGWREGRNPSAMFDTAAYLHDNPDVARQGLNPLAHYASGGLGQGRRPSPWFDDQLELPLPESAWEQGASRVERVVRTFVCRRNEGLTGAQAEALAREVQARAAAQGRLRAPQAATADRPVATLIVPVFNQLKFTLWCLHAVLATRYRCSFEIVVVDDASVDDTAAVLESIPEVRYVRSATNQGFIGSCGLGAQEARGQYLVFLNNDTLPLPGWLDALVDTFGHRPDAGIVGSKLIYPDGRLQEAGGIVWQNGEAWNYGRDGDRTRPEFNYLRSADYCSGAALAVPAGLFREAGGFDPALAPAYGEDLDLALRLRARGFAVLYQPLSEVVHLEGGTAGTSLRKGAKAYQVRNMETLAERWRLPLRAHRPAGLEPHLEKDRDAERRVLFIDAFTPRPDQDAGSLDALHWMRALAGLGYQVTFLPCFDLRHAGKYTTLLQQEGIECVYLPSTASPEELIAARGSEFDLCVFYRSQVADLTLPAVRRGAPQAKRLLALCDLSHLRLQRQAAISGSARDERAALEARLRELLACTQCDALWTPSAFEQDLLRRELPEARVFAWPLAQELRPPRKAHGERSGIGFLGGYRHAPNVDAVLYFVREILPHVLSEEPDIRLYVAGSHMPPEIADIAHPAVEILGHVDDLGAFFDRMRVFVAPIRFGAGVKGKVAASLSAGVPVVGTSIAWEGMGLPPDEGGMAADEPREFARQVVRIHRSEELWSQLSRRGFARAEREYSAAAGTRNVARAMVELGVGTRLAQEYLERWGETGAATSTRGGLWPEIAGMQIDVCTGAVEYHSLKAGEAWRQRAELEERLLRDAENGQVLHRGYSIPARRPVVYQADVALDGAGRPQARWREELVCPITGLNNRQRAVAAFAKGLLEAPGENVTDVYLTEQVTPLFQWMSSAFPTAAIAGSEYLGPGIASGETRGGIRHQDVERLGFASASLDLVVSCDVLEHVNEPERALCELARVLRPGGHLLFTVPFSSHTEKNRRRARDRDGSVEHFVEPCYHGNPLDPQGALAYFDYGWELLDWVRAAGFREVSVLCYWSDALGHLGGTLEAFYARR